MKLIVTKDDILNVFAARTGLAPHEIQIDLGGQDAAPNIHSDEVRAAIYTFWNEGRVAKDGQHPNKISLIKATRRLTGCSLKEGMDFVESHFHR